MMLAAILAAVLPGIAALQSAPHHAVEDLPLATSNKAPAQSARQDAKDEVQITFSVKKPGGSPLGAARIQLTWEGPDEERKQQSGLTGSDGQIDFTVPAGARVKWTTEPPVPRDKKSYGETRSGKWTAPMDRDAAEIDVVLRTDDDATFVARFVDAETKRPLYGVRVQRIDGEDALPWRMLVGPPKTPTAKANKVGIVEVPAATWRTCHLLIFAEGYAYSHLIIGGKPSAPGLQEVLELPLLREATLQITLLDGTEDMRVSAVSSLSATRPEDDNPDFMMRCMVTFHSEPIGEEGVHLISGLAPGSKAELTLIEGDTPGRDLDSITCGKAGSEERLIFDCWKRGVIGGTFEVQGEASPAGRTVHLFRHQQSLGLKALLWAKPLGITRTDPEGRFRFQGLAVGEYYALAPASTEPGALPDQVSQPVAVEVTSEAPRADVKIQETTGGYLSGILTDSQGAPCQAPITADCEYRKFKLTSGAKGTFRIGPFHPKDNVRIWASPPQGRWAECRCSTTRLSAPMDEIDLALKPAGRLDLTIAGMPSMGRHFDLKVEMTGGGGGGPGGRHHYSFGGSVRPDGSFSKGGIVPGHYTVEVNLGPSRQSKPVEIEIRAGEITAGIELELPPG